MQTGKQNFEYHVTAAHKTINKGYVDLYISKDNWSPDSPITWDTIEDTPFCHWVPDRYPTPIQQGGPSEQFSCTLPKEKSGQHVIFAIWQRDDSEEAFYSCSDVIVESFYTTEKPPPTTTEKPTTKATTTQSTTKSTAQEPVTEFNTNGLISADDTIRPLGSSRYLCATDMGEIEVDLLYCTGASNQKWEILPISSYFSVSSKSSSLCWEIVGQDAKIVLSECDQFNVLQRFNFYEGQLHPIVNQRLCISHVEQEGNGLQLKTCVLNLFGEL